MTRTLPATVTSAVTNDETRPVYLIRMDINTPRRAATWDVNITYDGAVWAASGIEVSNISASGARLKMPNGQDDPWRDLLLTHGFRGKPIKIYEHHTDLTASPQTAAVLIFSGIMDDARITDEISVTAIDDSQVKGFPYTAVDRPVFNFLLEPGDSIRWGPDKLVVS